MGSMSLPGSRAHKSKFRIKVAVRLLIICFFACLTVYLAFASPYWLLSLWTALITAGLFHEAVSFVTKSEKKLESFLQAVREDDFTLTFSQEPGSNDYNLNEAFNQVNATFKRLRSFRESEHQLLQIIVEHAGIPIICFDERSDAIYLANGAAKKMMKVQFLSKITNLAHVNISLPDFLRGVRDGEKETLRLELSGKQIVLSVDSRHVVFQDRHLKLIALHDVTSELAGKEAETWQKLLRVLTHEINNSAIPLSTLSSYLHEIIINARQQQRELSREEWDDILLSLKTIDQRSRTLKEFVQNVRSVNQIPEPRPQPVSLEQIVRASVQLFTEQLRASRISVKFSISNELFVFADANLTPQVLINIIKNAAESMAASATDRNIYISAQKDDSQFVYLTVRDSGDGIAAEDLDQIFIPFFSTKKRGSGIGLSVSKQIMQRQKGDISVRSQQGQGSEFTLTFAAVPVSSTSELNLNHVS